jgi:hypothetical protein
MSMALSQTLLSLLLLGSYGKALEQNPLCGRKGISQEAAL